MTLTEIKTTIANGQKVYWSTFSYQVVKDSNDHYLIVCRSTSYNIALTWLDGTTLNGKESDFFTE